MGTRDEAPSGDPRALDERRGSIALGARVPSPSCWRRGDRGDEGMVGTRGRGDGGGEGTECPKALPGVISPRRDE
eukprot:749338-Prorocentrum_minimum.AAC.1